MKIVVVILHFGRIEVTLECLDSLQNLDLKGVTLTTLVINNTGKKEVEDQLKNHSLKATVLTPEKNLGFAEGNNWALKQIDIESFEWIWFLNNDTVVYKDFIQIFNKELNLIIQINLGAVGPVIEHTVGKTELYDLGGKINWLKGQPFHINAKENPTQKRSLKRDFISGCSMLVSVSTWKSVGQFKEDYFMYLEDVEWCIRAGSKDFAILVLPRLRLFHKGSQSTAEIMKIYYSWRNGLRFCWQWVPWQYKVTSLCWNLVFYPLLYTRWQMRRLKRNLFQSKI